MAIALVMAFQMVLVMTLVVASSCCLQWIWLESLWQSWRRHSWKGLSSDSSMAGGISLLKMLEQLLDLVSFSFIVALVVDLSIGFGSLILVCLMSLK